MIILEKKIGVVLETRIVQLDTVLEKNVKRKESVLVVLVTHNVILVNVGIGIVVNGVPAGITVNILGGNVVVDGDTEDGIVNVTLVLI